MVTIKEATQKAMEFAVDALGEQILDVSKECGEVRSMKIREFAAA